MVSPLGRAAAQCCALIAPVTSVSLPAPEPMGSSVRLNVGVTASGAEACHQVQSSLSHPHLVTANDFPGHRTFPLSSALLFTMTPFRSGKATGGREDTGSHLYLFHPRSSTCAQLGLPFTVPINWALPGK